MTPGAHCRWMLEQVVLVVVFSGGQMAMQGMAQASRPLPEPGAYLQAASDKEDSFAEIRQQYLCVFKHTKVVAQTVRTYESFYIHGHEVQRLLAVNDVSLSPAQQQVEEARVRAEVAADELKPEVRFVGLAGGMYISAGEHRWAQSVEGSIVRAATFTAEQRGMYRGRVSIQINFVGNQKFKAITDEERIAKVMAGFFIVDEESGAIVRVSAKAMADAWSQGRYLIPRGIDIGFDATRIAEGFYLPSSWESSRYAATPIMSPGYPPRTYEEVEDFWLQSCRKYRSEVQILPGVVPVEEQTK